MDLDYKDDEEMSFEQIKSVCKVICDKGLKGFGGKDALISVAEPKPIDTLIKTGIHINWPGFVVNRSSHWYQRSCYKYVKLGVWIT